MHRNEDEATCRIFCSLRYRCRSPPRDVTLWTWTIIRNVGDIDAQDRKALEHVLGQRLDLNQQLVIRVINLNVAPPANHARSTEGTPASTALPGWCDVYAGLTDEQIADLEKAILTRANLTRPSE